MKCPHCHKEITPQAKFDFDALYRLYPCKKSKQQGMAQCRKLIITRPQYLQLETAIKNYAAYCKKNPDKYQMHFSTFIGTKTVQRWKDWLAGPIERVKPTKESMIRIESKLRDIKLDLARRESVPAPKGWRDAKESKTNKS